MNPAQLRNKLGWEGGVIGALEEGITDSDIDDDDLSEMWYELQLQWESLSEDIAEFEEALDEKAGEDAVD